MTAQDTAWACLVEGVSFVAGHLLTWPGTAPDAPKDTPATQPNAEAFTAGFGAREDVRYRAFHAVAGGRDAAREAISAVRATGDCNEVRTRSRRRFCGAPSATVCAIVRSQNVM